MIWSIIDKSNIIDIGFCKKVIKNLGNHFGVIISTLYGHLQQLIIQRVSNF